MISQPFPNYSNSIFQKEEDDSYDNFAVNHRNGLERDDRSG